MFSSESWGHTEGTWGMDKPHIRHRGCGFGGLFYLPHLNPQTSSLRYGSPEAGGVCPSEGSSGSP